MICSSIVTDTSDAHDQMEWICRLDLADPLELLCDSLSAALDIEEFLCDAIYFVLADLDTKFNSYAVL